MTQAAPQNIVIVDELPEIVFGEGEHSFRLVFNPKEFKNCHNLQARVVDSQGGHVSTRLDRWGTKMRVHMVFSPQHVEGVCRVGVEGEGLGHVVVARFWFVR